MGTRSANVISAKTPQCRRPSAASSGQVTARKTRSLCCCPPARYDGGNYRWMRKIKRRNSARRDAVCFPSSRRRITRKEIQRARFTLRRCSRCIRTTWPPRIGSTCDDARTHPHVSRCCILLSFSLSRSVLSLLTFSSFSLSQIASLATYKKYRRKGISEQRIEAGILSVSRFHSRAVENILL